MSAEAILVNEDGWLPHAALTFTIASLGADPRSAGTMELEAVSRISAGEALRVRLGAGRMTDPETLAALAADESVTVRAAVAMNTATPRQADRELALDPDERIRALLARKLVSILPNLSSFERDHLQEHAQAMLALLVEDEAVRVRTAIATALAHMPEAPRELILRLAHDRSMPVSDPVIRLSPILSQADLLRLLAASPATTTGLSVANRPCIGSDVSDMLAATADRVAIAALLANPSAAIREATLDALVGRAADEQSWHEPLVRRPRLSARSAQALSEIVATNLLEVLAQRADLGDETKRELAERLAEALAPPDASGADQPDAELAMAAARRLHDDNLLTEAWLLAAVQRGDVVDVMTALAVVAGVKLVVIELAIKLRSAKGLVSLVWRAGFSMQLAPPLQMLLTRFGPGKVLGPRPGYAFPLAEEEMRWQIEFLERKASGEDSGHCSADQASLRA